MSRQSSNVGIVTLYGSSNFGNRLQNYAVTRTLEQLGYRPETLILRPVLWRGACRELLKRLAARLRLPGRHVPRQRSFMAFDRRVPTKLVWSRRHLERLSERYALVVCGSDQIWKPYNVNLGEAAFADFFLGAKVALSPSFGVDELPSIEKSAVASALGSFDALSVREFSGQRIIRELVGAEVPVLIDPTLSISAEEWLRVADERLVPSAPFVLTLVLGTRPPDFDTDVYRHAGEDGLEVVDLANPVDRNTYGAGPQDFLALVAAAEYVISDSYHAAVFSTIFGTPFYRVARSEQHATSSRFETLEMLLQLEVGARGPASSYRLAPSEGTQRALDRERKRFSEFVANATGSAGRKSGIEGAC